MTQDYDNTDRGALFKNDRKTSDRHPDYKGSLDVGGVEYWVSAWIKDGRSGKFMSLALTAKDEEASAPPPAPAPRRQELQYRDEAPQRRGPPAPAPARRQAPAPSGFDDLDDDVPF